jgi:hypothetical protein
MTLAHDTYEEVALEPPGSRAFIERLIAACGARPTDHITVAGRRAIRFALDLCRRGYMQVTCRTESSGSAAADGPSHSLWIVNVPSETELVAMIGTLGRYLCAGGRLVLVFEVSISQAHAMRLRQVLAQKGFVARHQSRDRYGRAFLVFYGRQEESPASAQAA